MEFTMKNGPLKLGSTDTAMGTKKDKTTINAPAKLNFTALKAAVIYNAIIYPHQTGFDLD